MEGQDWETVKQGVILSLNLEIELALCFLRLGLLNGCNGGRASGFGGLLHVLLVCAVVG